MPDFPDYWPVTEEADTDHPFRLVAAPARTFLNSTFTETAGSQFREGKPQLLIHPEDMEAHGLSADALVRVGNTRGEVVLHITPFIGVRRGVVIAEGIWPNSRHKNLSGINSLTSADAPAPIGGAAFHDNRVWIKRMEAFETL